MSVPSSTRPPDFIWYDGRVYPWSEARVHVSELQWSGVGSVFEGLRAYWNAESGQSFIYGLDAHLQRLGLSMRILGFEGVDLGVLRDATLDIIRRNAARCDEYIRIFVWYHEGWNYTPDQPIHSFVMSRPFPSKLAEDVSFTAGVSTWRRFSEDAMPLRAKAVANYQSSRMAGVEAGRRGFDLPLLLNAQSHLVEGPRECVFLVKNGALATPPLHAGVLDSITRRTVMRLAEHLGIPCHERDIFRSELYECEEMFTAATASEIMPIVSIDGVAVSPKAPGVAGPVTRRIRDLYRRVVFGEVPLLDEMRTAVKA